MSLLADLLMFIAGGFASLSAFYFGTQGVWVWPALAACGFASLSVLVRP